MTEITRYYVCGSKNTVRDRIQAEGIENVVVPMTFPSEEAFRWFESGLEMSDGWMEVAGYDNYEDAVEDNTD